MPQNYAPEFKKKIVRLHAEEGRTYKSITAEYPNEMELMKENLRLRKELEEAKKENLFLKKAAAFFAKEIDQRLIDLLNNIKMNLVCAGSCAALISVQMLTTTTENTGRRIIMPGGRKYCQKLQTFITNTMA